MLLTLFIGLRIGGISGMLLLPVLVVVVITYYKNQIEE
jgi:predicted PurR-regulated permease PerM